MLRASCNAMCTSAHTTIKESQDRAMARIEALVWRCTSPKKQQVQFTANLTPPPETGWIERSASTTQRHCGKFP